MGAREGASSNTNSDLITGLETAAWLRKDKTLQAKQTASMSVRDIGFTKL